MFNSQFLIIISLAAEQSGLMLQTKEKFKRVSGLYLRAHTSTLDLKLWMTTFNQALILRGCLR